MTTNQTENLHTPNCVRTRSGNYVNVLNPDPETIDIEDIAHSLAHQCRFSGHLPEFYSVAQHSVLVSELVPNNKKFAALLHDASEAYLVDIARPVKNNLSNYKEIEERFMNVIARKFGFDWPMCEEITKADNEMLGIEWEYLMLENGTHIKCMLPAEAKAYFMQAYYNLIK